MENMQVLYTGILLVYTIDPKMVLETRGRLLLEELAYGPIANRYALMGNISIPEGIIMFAPVLYEGDLNKFATDLKSGFKGIEIKSLIVTEVLVGSLCNRRFDNTYSQHYDLLADKLETIRQERKTYE